MKKRKDGFFGLHFDFHGTPGCGVQGATLREQDIREICRLIKPDFIQIDCKGHPGWASYPSKLGNALPEFAQDTLALWRRVTREEDVALYMHYSGIYDCKYCSEHPEQTVLNADGTYSKGATRLDGSYVDDLLIPQLCELAGDYGVDGAWIDGECWKATADFRRESLVAFEKATEIRLNGTVPATPNDPYYQEYREYHRELFREYLRHYVDAVHEKYPDFQIASNWAFSDQMPEEVSANVDFISGDFSPADSFNSARYAARALAQQEGYAWDLMSWNFRRSVGKRSGYITKHPKQLLQEAAAVISLGGAYQNYIMQHGDGSPNLIAVRKLKELSDFVRARKDYCFRGTPIHQAALLLSTYDRHRESGRLYSRTGFEKIKGMSNLLCDIGQSLEIISEHTLRKRIDAYKMIVVPELYCGLENDTLKSLLTYAEKGGNLVLVGKNTCSVFADAGAPFTVKKYIEHMDSAGNTQDDGHNITLNEAYKPYYFTLDGTAYGTLYSPCGIMASGANPKAFLVEKLQNQGDVLSVTVPYGKGHISALGFDIGSQYQSGRQYLHRELMKQIVNELYVPIVRIESVCGVLEIVVLKKDGKVMIQLVNAGGNHADPSCDTEDYIPPILDLQLSIEFSKCPKELILQPEGISLPFEYRDGRAYVGIDRINIHSVIEVVL